MRRRGNGSGEGERKGKGGKNLFSHLVGVLQWKLCRKEKGRLVVGSVNFLVRKRGKERKRRRKEKRKREEEKRSSLP